jgi:hypothetical protein
MTTDSGPQAADANPPLDACDWTREHLADFLDRMQRTLRAPLPHRASQASRASAASHAPPGHRCSPEDLYWDLQSALLCLQRFLNRNTHHPALQVPLLRRLTDSANEVSAWLGDRSRDI